MAEQQQQLIDCFENPFLGMEGKIMKKLGETEDGHQRVEAGAGCEQDGEQQMFETFVKEKGTLLRYVHDMISFAAKTQNIELSGAKVLPEAQEETKEEESLRIQTTKDACLIAARVNAVLEKYQE